MINYNNHSGFVTNRWQQPSHNEISPEPCYTGLVRSHSALQRPFGDLASINVMRALQNIYKKMKWHSARGLVPRLQAGGVRSAVIQVRTEMRLLKLGRWVSRTRPVVMRLICPPSHTACWVRLSSRVLSPPLAMCHQSVSPAGVTGVQSRVT